MGKSIMIQGTASGVGKSMLMTGLCRIFKQDGYSVAPFKAQNMSSVSHTFQNGTQMARSQALAAYACGVEPSVDMNPVLLKPSDKMGSEVICSGKSIGYLKNFEYNALKKRLAEESLAAYRRLLDRYDIVVAEGAGSPVEMNLKENDIVNMGFAQRAKCPVLLVSDISKGGVFASLYGTIMLFTPEERELVKGLIVNKFYGFKEHFKDGVDILENLTKKPVLGVVPHAPVEIEDEDSLADHGIIKTKASIEKNIPEGITYLDYMNIQFDKLADVLRKNLDLPAIYKILGV